MGDIKKQKNKFYPPSHPWQKARIEEERVLLREFGLKNKEEIWKMNSILKNFYAQAKRLTKIHDKQAEVEIGQLLSRLRLLGLLGAEGKLEDVLTIKIKDVMNRRLQTLLFKKNMAHSVNQARQFIVHHHVFVGGKNVTMPSYLVKVEEESSIIFKPNSSLANPDHPERAVPEKPAEKKEEAKDQKKKAPKKKAKPVEKPEAKRENKEPKEQPEESEDSEGSEE